MTTQTLKKVIEFHLQPPHINRCCAQTIKCQAFQKRSAVLAIYGLLSDCRTCALPTAVCTSSSASTLLSSCALLQYCYILQHCRL